MAPSPSPKSRLKRDKWTIPKHQQLTVGLGSTCTWLAGSQVVPLNENPEGLCANKKNLTSQAHILLIWPGLVSPRCIVLILCIPLLRPPLAAKVHKSNLHLFLSKTSHTCARHDPGALPRA